MLCFPYRKGLSLYVQALNATTLSGAHKSLFNRRHKKYQIKGRTTNVTWLSRNFCPRAHFIHLPRKGRTKEFHVLTNVFIIFNQGGGRFFEFSERVRPKNKLGEFQFWVFLSFLSFNLTSIPGQYPDQKDPFDDNYIVDLSKTLLLLSRQETKYKATAFWLAKCINSGSKLHGVNCFPNCWLNLQRMSWWAGHTNNGLHPQQLLGNIDDKSYLSSGHSQALLPATLYLQTMVWTFEPWQRLPELNICDHLQIPLMCIWVSRFCYTTCVHQLVCM